MCPLPCVFLSLCVCDLVNVPQCVCPWLIFLHSAAANCIIFMCHGCVLKDLTWTWHLTLSQNTLFHTAVSCLLTTQSPVLNAARLEGADNTAECTPDH